MFFAKFSVYDTSKISLVFGILKVGDLDLKMEFDPQCLITVPTGISESHCPRVPVVSNEYQIISNDLKMCSHFSISLPLPQTVSLVRNLWGPHSIVSTSRKNWSRRARRVLRGGAPCAGVVLLGQRVCVCVCVCECFGSSVSRLRRPVCRGIADRVAVRPRPCAQFVSRRLERQKEAFLSRPVFGSTRGGPGVALL